MTSIIVKAVKYHAIDDQNGYAVEKHEDKYRVVFVQKTQVDGQDVLMRLGESKSNGRPHEYESPFQADWAIRKEILPLYARSA